MPAFRSQIPTVCLRLWRSKYQALVFGFCLLFGLAMIVNIQLAGEASWFWYATLLHRGVKLYADLHLPLQPFYALETDAWLQVAGRRVIPFELLSVLHLFLLCLGMLLVLRNSSWPDWRKAFILAGAFFTDIWFLAIRFDDFHVVNDSFIIFSVVLLLALYRASRLSSRLLIGAAAGVLSGLCFTNRSTDGGTLLAGACLCVPFLARRHKWLTTAAFLAAAAASIVMVVHLTGDTWHDYLANSVFHAAAAKGGMGTVLRGPLLAPLDNLRRMTQGVRWMLLVAGILIPGALVRYVWRDTARAVVSVETALLGLAMAAAWFTALRRYLYNGSTVGTLDVAVQSVVFPLCVLVLARFILARTGRLRGHFDPREVLIFVPAATLVSAAASQATGTSNSTVSLMLMLLLSAFWLPLSGRFRWLTDSWMVISLVLSLSCIGYKINTPYAWNAYIYDRFFVGRQWYHHPVYGPMYIESDLLHFVEPVCATIDSSSPHPELLSLPYSYPNYFCAIAPWHGYVQTWFDTSTPQTIAMLMQQLNEAPPQWIEYERQLEVLHAHENEYNGGRPMAHRALDEMIMAKLASGQWKLVRKDDYLKGDGWYLIETHP